MATLPTIFSSSSSPNFYPHMYCNNDSSFYYRGPSHSRLSMAIFHFNTRRLRPLMGRQQQGFSSRRVVMSAAATNEDELERPAVSRDGIENLVIIGSGPAGYTASIYAARANLKPVVFEGYQKGGVPGGQLMTTTEVENFPGFPDGITGPDLMDRMKRQAERWGAELIHEDVEYVDVRNRPFTIRSCEHEVKCHSLIVATGATAKRLGLPRENEFWSKGISACAICDGASPLFKGQELAVVGGGDTATEEAIYLTKYARHVHLLVRKDKLKASKAMQDRIFNNPNVTVHFNKEVVDVVSNEKGQISGLLVKSTNTSEQLTLDVRGLFYGIGHTPNSVGGLHAVSMGAAGGAFMGNLKGLPPGFRFHPTDEELVCHYLRKKSSKSSKHNVYLDLITEIDFYKHEPYDLPGISCFEGTGLNHDKQWFFFTQGDSKKYTKGSRLNRATQGGYWKTTGRDREVVSNGVTVGMKKTLVFYQGRAPNANRTNWIMYEYRLVNDSAAAAAAAKLCSSENEPLEKDSFVLCRVFLKNGSEKKTKEHHGNFYQGENSTAAGYAVATEKEEHENVAISTAREVEIKDRDLPFGPFTASSEENCFPPDDDLQKLLLECLHDPAEEETGEDLVQISDGGAQSSLFDEPFASSKDTDILNNEASILRPGYTDDSRINGENSVPTDDFMHGDTSEQWDFDGFSTPSALAGDFLELKDFTLPW